MKRGRRRKEWKEDGRGREGDKEKRKGKNRGERGKDRQGVRK